MLTVAVSFIDRRFDVNVVLGNSKVLKGMSQNPAGLKGSHALVPVNAAAAPGVTSVNASFCKPSTLNSAVVRGKIVICSIERIGDDRPAKAREVQRAGGIWMILVDPISIDIAFEFVIPSALIGVAEAQVLVAYVTSASKPVGAITPTFTVLNQLPAPEIAVFSSAGPSALIQISSNLI